MRSFVARDGEPFENRIECRRIQPFRGVGQHRQDEVVEGRVPPRLEDGQGSAEILQAGVEKREGHVRMVWTMGVARRWLFARKALAQASEISGADFAALPGIELKATAPDVAREALSRGPPRA